MQLLFAIAAVSSLPGIARPRKTLAISLTAIIIAFPIVCSAAPVTLFNSFGPNDTTNQISGFNTQHLLPHPELGAIQVDNAVQVIVAVGPVLINNYVLAITRRDIGNWVRLELHTDDNGAPGATILEQIDILNYPVDITFTHNPQPPVTIHSPTHPVLQQGDKVWVVLTAPEAIHLGDNHWILNDDPARSSVRLAYRDTLNTHYQWQSYNSDFLPSQDLIPAMRVTGTLVPEPSALILAAFGGLSLLAFRRWHS